jgi:hypothetical protein
VEGGRRRAAPGEDRRQRAKCLRAEQVH